MKVTIKFEDVRFHRAELPLTLSAEVETQDQAEEWMKLRLGLLCPLFGPAHIEIEPTGEPPTSEPSQRSNPIKGESSNHNLSNTP